MLRVVLACVAVIATGTASAHAGQWKNLGLFNGPPVAAGDGLVVARSGDHGLAVLGPTGEQRRYDFGAQCRFIDVAGGGRAVALCDTGQPDARAIERLYWELLDLRSGAISVLRSLPELDTEGGFPQITGIGRRWITVMPSFNYHVRLEWYWNPATGELAYPQSFRGATDLNADRPETRLCRPLKRPVNPGNGFSVDPPFFDLKRTEHHGVFRAWISRYGTVLDTVPAELLAWRCGHSTPTLVSRCRYGYHPPYDGSYDDNFGNQRYCSFFDARYGLVAWPTGRGVGVMDLRNGRRRLLRGLYMEPIDNARVAIGKGSRVYATRSSDYAPYLSARPIFVTRGR